MSIKNTPKRRRRPFGSVFRRPGGPGWLVRIPHPEGGKTASGRPRYLTRSVGSKAEGEALLREVRKASLTGTLATPEPEQPCELTVLQAIDGHIDALGARGCSEKTLEVHGCSRRAIERHGLGHTNVRDLTAAQVESYLAWRRKHVWRTKCRPGKPPKAVLVKGGKASASTVGRDRELMSASINRLIRLGQMTENVVAKVPKPKRPKATRTVLSKAEIAKLFSVCGEQLRPVVMALAYTGARKSEILRLRWKHICFESGTISLYRPKVSNFSRIPMHPALAAELQRIREGRPRAKDSDAVFLSRLGTPYRDFKEAFGTAVRRAGLQDRGVTAHCLRHSFACHFLENGAAVTDLQAVLGHASLVTTQIYARMVDRRTRTSIEALSF